MRISITFKTYASYIVSLLFIILFTYAAVSKLLEFQNFQAQLGQSPLISAYTAFISYAVIIIELVIAVLLAIPKTRLLAIVLSYILMVIFTSYIIVILNYATFVPCSCGGILEDMNWEQHLLFNIVFTLLAAIVILITSTDRFHEIIRLTIITIVSSGTIVLMYLNSEHIMHRENPFIRRFIQGSAIKNGQIETNSNSKYLAGADKNYIYLGDDRAPLHIMAYDSTLKIKKHYKIQLEKEDFPFTSVHIKIVPPYFYVVDGTVPVIYKGKISDWKAKLLMYGNTYYFSRAEVLSEDKIAFRTQLIKTQGNILGIFNFKDSLQLSYAPQLLQKQIDGFFDTDGMMNYEANNKTFVYVYYYRNQFIVANENLNLIYRGKTIDTISKANLKVVKISETGQRKIASVPTVVNQLTSISNNSLFVNSNILGRYESKQMWKRASIVDVYDIKKNIYKSSFYIHDVNKTKLQSMIISGKNLYALVGHHLVKYRLSKYVVNDSISHIQK